MAQYPPGGFAPPPPGGFAPPPPPMYGSGGQPPKSPKTGLIAMIGCGVVLMLVAGGMVVGGMFWSMSSRSAPAPVAVGPAAAAPGGTCSKTADCCRKIVQASGGDPAALKSCDNFLQLPDTSCSAALEGYKKSATMLKLQCD